MNITQRSNTLFLYAARALVAFTLALTACSGGDDGAAGDDDDQTGTVSGALVIDAPDARACEILLSSDATSVQSVTYGANVRGQLRARSPRTALAVMKSDDAAFGADAIILQLDGDAANVSVQKVVCYDASGTTVSGASAKLD